jgi:acetyl esterase/lipase
MPATIPGLLLAAAVSAGSPSGAGEAPTPLWPGEAPGQRGSDEADRPTLSAHLPPRGRGVGAAVIVCPGGGYARLALDHEGAQIARWLNERGIAAFVLRYRLGPKYRHPVPLGDLQRAIRTVRAGAARWAVAPSKIGVWGFSAGGHLASTAATLFDDGAPGAPDPIDRVSSRPDFAILAYPVVFMGGEGTHQGSRQQLLGDAPAPALVERLSTHKQVTPRTPPVFLLHTTEDTVVPPENSVAFYLALRKAGVPAELHVYERGRHGVGLAQGDPILSSWGDRLADWLRVRGILPPRSP